MKLPMNICGLSKSLAESIHLKLNVIIVIFEYINCVPTNKQLADVLTKPLPASIFQVMRRKIVLE